MQIYCPVSRSLKERREKICFSVTHTTHYLLCLQVTHQRSDKPVRNASWFDSYRRGWSVQLMYRSVQWNVRCTTDKDKYDMMLWKENKSAMAKCADSQTHRADRISLLGIRSHSSSHRPLHSVIEAPLWERHKSSLLWRESAWQRLDMGQHAHRQLPLLHGKQSHLGHQCTIWRAGMLQTS